MLRVIRFEIQPGNRPGARIVYARMNNGELRRVPRERAQAILLRFDIHEANKGHRGMRYIRINRMKLLFVVLAAVVIIVALTVNFPSF